MKNIRRFNIFVVRIYLENWFLCQIANKAPANDLKLLKNLEKYKEVDGEIGMAVQKKFLRHLWYINENNVALAFFDDDVSIEMKRKMILNLQQTGHPDKPQRITLPIDRIMTAELCDFVSVHTYFFFDTVLNERLLGINREFLTADPSTWDTNENYITAKEVVSNLKIVNDIAERGIALITRFNAILTHQEKQKQFILHAIEQHCNNMPYSDFSKTKFIEYLNKNYTQKTNMLNK